MTHSICVYMLDGERSCASWESPQFCAYIGPARNRTRLWRGQPTLNH